MAFVTGNGATIAFGTSSYAAPIVNFSGLTRSREAIDASTLATTDDRVFIPEALVDNGEFTVTVQHTPGAMAPVDGASETITITLPASGSGVTTQGAFAFTGFVTSTALDEVANGSILTETYTVKISGAVTETPEA